MVHYPLATNSWDSSETDAITEVLEDGTYTMGKRVAQFEKQFADYLGVPYCVMVNSGSSANLLMVAALFYRSNGPLHPGDEVIVPAVSWSTTYFPLHQYGLKLKFVDVDLETLNYDLTALARAVTAQTRLVMTVNLLGNPNDFDVIQSLIGDKDILLIEDNCEALGAEYQGARTGTFGLMSTCSFFFSHHISTMEGGCIATSDEELYHILLCLRAHGWTRNLPKRNLVTGVKEDDAFEESFKFVLPGYNVRPIEMSAAAGIRQLSKLPQFVSRRRENAARFQELFSRSQHFLIQREVGSSSWFGFSLVIRPTHALDRASVVSALGEAQIECRPIVAGNFAKNPVLRWIDHELSGELRNASWIDSHGLFVGNQEKNLAPQLDHLASVLRGLET